jgi:flagellar protein FliS
MSSAASRAAAVYRATQVESCSPLELVAMLYDGLTQALTQARDALARGDLRQKQVALSRALRMVSELQNSLNHESGGEVARQLDALYTYLTTRLVESNVKKDPSGFDEALRLLAPLREAWTQIAGGGPATGEGS